ncbi:DUF4097 family beta strand repeat-containing protein [Clostridium sp. MB40-C1]|uniref:DUF4097 family beta strand repeat-containing protein n=1 Tax=Clostridium sp. MB40-C1 TaxID=3070996 RepID=UPI0027E201B0|nr:DUF4097 family beta strand repeat-containing protein [Clostridium sp. MB40-C1]WMJ79846.1 DUF4097 family beta strand repeat-containing protein [Clostridium sp. MB40-C1]
MIKLFKNIKNFQLVIIAVLGIGIGSSILFFSNDFSFKRFFLEDNKNVIKEVIKENMVPLSNINKIDVDSDSADVNIVSEERKDIKVKFEKAKDSKKANYNLNVAVNNNSLDIKASNNKKLLNIISLGDTEKVTITIYLPKNYNKNLNVDTSLGSIDLKDIKLDNVICELGLGSMNITNVQAENFKCNNKNGKIIANKLYTNSTTINASLGKAILKEFTGALEMDMGNGSADISYVKLNNNVNIKQSLGDVDISLPKNAEFYLDADTKLGDLQCDFPVTIQGNVKDEGKLEGVVKADKYKVIIKNSNGDINIKQR